MDKDLVDKVKGVKLLEIGDNNKQVYVMSILEVIRRINTKYPDIEIDSIGEVDVIIEYIPNLNRKGITRNYVVRGGVFDRNWVRGNSFL